MPTLNLDLDFVDHPKVKRLIARTGHEGVTCLLRLWSYAGKFHKRDGSLASYSDDEIEQFAGWQGVRGGFLQAILDVSLMDSNKSIHDWQDHAGHLALYHERAKDMNKKRWSSAKESVKESVIDPTRTPSSVQSRSEQISSEQVLNSPATPEIFKEREEQLRKDGIKLGQIALTRRYKGGGEDAMRLTAMIWNQYKPYNITPKMFEWIINAKIIPNCNDVQHCLAYSRKIGDVKGEHVSEARRFIAVED